MKIKRLLFALAVFDVLAVVAILTWSLWRPALSPLPTPSQPEFNGQNALQDVATQVEFGARIPGSPAHKQTIDYIQSELELAGWSSDVLEQKINGHTAYNILATRDKQPPVFLLGAHYDSRLLADNDAQPANRSMPVPGANDGASGVAVLLEIARSLPAQSSPCALLFIDIEDNGHLPGWDWIQGSTAFAADMSIQPKAVVIVDMIGDADLNIFMEKNSDSGLTKQIWQTANILGYGSVFIPQYKYSVLDDHVPFLNKGLRTVDIIDLDYKYWHTVQDTPDKVSADSLEKVGRTLMAWMQAYGTCLSQENCNEK